MVIKPMGREVAAHIVHMLQNPQRFSNNCVTISFDASHKTFADRALVIQTTTFGWNDEDDTTEIYRVRAACWAACMRGDFSGMVSDYPHSLPSTCPVLGEWYDYNHAPLNLPTGTWMVDHGYGPEEARFRFCDTLGDYVWDGSSPPLRILIDRYF